MEDPTHRYQREIAVVTGASSGIGWAVARALAGRGLRVALLARRRERLLQLVEEIEAEGGSAMAFETDLARPEEIERAFSEVRQALGPVRVVVNNAGLGHSAPLVSGQTARWAEMLQVNVLALCVCTREAVSDMQANGEWGQVIHISSMSAHRVPEGSGVYSATKFAVRSLTESLRRELRALKSQIRVASVSPGFVETEFAEKYHRDKQKAEETYSAYQVLSAEDIARSVLYILAQPDHVQVHDLLLRPTEQIS